MEEIEEAGRVVFCKRRGSLSLSYNFRRRPFLDDMQTPYVPGPPFPRAKKIS